MKALMATALIAVALAVVPAANAAVPKTGTWRGDHTQILDAFTYPGAEPFTYKTTMVIVELYGHIKSIVGQVRMECPATVGVRDARVLKSWKTGRGPDVGRRGGFTLRADGAYIHGTVSRSSIIGGSLATYGAGPDGPACRGTGRFNLQRRW
jgi:hypothetical protein